MSENNRQDTGREACSQKLCPELRHFLLRILCSNLVGISPRQLEDAHRATSKSDRIAAHPAIDRWQEPRRSSSPLPDEHAARRIVVQPRRAKKTIASSISQRSTWIRTTMNRVNLRFPTMCAATSELPGQPRARYDDAHPKPSKLTGTQIRSRNE